MIDLRILSNDDIAAALELSAAAGWNQNEKDWQRMRSLAPAGCIAAHYNGTLVGTVCALSYPQGFGFIGMMLVHQDYKRQGIGKKLMASAMTVLEHCSQIKLDASAEGRPLYLLLGFEDEGRLTRMLLDRTMQSGPTIAEQITETDIRTIGAVDGDIFGGDRMDLLRSVFRGNEHFARCVRNSGAIRSYVFGRNGARFHHIGPLIAQSQHDARQLLEAAVANQRDLPIIIDIFDANRDWKSWLLQQGFTEQRSFMRMNYRSRNVAGNLSKQFAITGPEYG